MAKSPAPFLDLAVITSSNSHLDEEYTTSSYARGSTDTVSPKTSLTSSCSIGLFNTRCGLCHDTFVNPKVLTCFHTFCQVCLEGHQEQPHKLQCPRCQQECLLPAKGVAGLLPDFTVKSPPQNKPPVPCTSCKVTFSNAVAHCYDCNDHLCSNCAKAHQFMYCFKNHRVLTLSSQGENEESKTGTVSPTDKNTTCGNHKMEVLKYFCQTCNVPACTECILIDHPAELHEFAYLTEIGPKQVDLLNQTVQESKSMATGIQIMLKTLEHSPNGLQVLYHTAQNEINDAYHFYLSKLDERKQEMFNELETVFSMEQGSLREFRQKATETLDEIQNISEFSRRLTEHANMAELSMFKNLLDSKPQGLTSYNIDGKVPYVNDIEFVSNYQAIQVGVKNALGYIKYSPEINHGSANKEPPIARPVTVNSNTNLIDTSSLLVGNTSAKENDLFERSYTNDVRNPSSLLESNIMFKRLSTTNSLGPFPTSSLSELNMDVGSLYGKWSNGVNSLSLTDHTDKKPAESPELLPTTRFPPCSPIRRQKMIYNCKFGEYGITAGYFTEPGGIAVNGQNDIIVADSNTHRIQIFDKVGRFKFQFGQFGSGIGQLMYPIRVAVVKPTGDIIVTERSPTNQIQIYNQYGKFLRKFGSNILQHPRGVTVDSKGRILVVESKVMRVIIFDQYGTVLKQFRCSHYLAFPNGLAVNDQDEIFVSDNRSHCVKVFNYEGAFLRQIGCLGITDYPIGVTINSAGEILVADNHHNFNLTIFTQDGHIVSAFESKIKHTQLFDVALMDDGSMVLASKDYRVYIYRYPHFTTLRL